MVKLKFKGAANMNYHFERKCIKGGHSIDIPIEEIPEHLFRHELFEITNDKDEIILEAPKKKKIAKADGEKVKIEKPDVKESSKKESDVKKKKKKK